MKLGEVVAHIEYYNFTKFHYILMKKIIGLYQTHLTDGLSVSGRWIAMLEIKFMICGTWLVIIPHTFITAFKNTWYDSFFWLCLFINCRGIWRMLWMCNWIFYYSCHGNCLLAFCQIIRVANEKLPLWNLYTTSCPRCWNFSINDIYRMEILFSCSSLS